MTDINFVFNRAIKLIINAKAEWQIIQTETHTKTEVIKNYALPWIIVITLCSIVSDFIIAASVAYVLTKAVITFVMAFSVMYLSSIVINEITTSFNSKKDINTTFKLVVYSLTAYFIITSITYLIPLPPIQMLMVFALYSIYLYWVGSAPLVGTPEDNKVGFVVVSSLIIVGIYAVLYLILFNVILDGLFRS
jgi:hypothetical protein